MIDIKKVHNETIYAISENPAWRVGQSLFNTIYSLYPDYGNRIRGTVIDPYHKTIMIKDLNRAVIDIDTFLDESNMERK